MVTRVAIVGSGIGGLVLAKTLTQYGAGKVEAWDEWKTRGGSLGIQQSSLILEKLGLKEVFDALANHPKATKYWSDGQDLQKMVLDSIPPEVIFLGHKLESLTEDDKEVTLTFANGKVDKADIVVGADGIHSVVKKQIFDCGEPVHAGFRLIYSCSSVPIRPNPEEVHVNWISKDGEGYHVMDWSAGAADKRHDVCLLMMRSEELISDKWDSTIVKDKLKELTSRVAPGHEVLHAAIENAEMCFDWGSTFSQCFQLGFLPNRE
ncbi:nicC [Symbiodinium sp. CCMP2456]|nr:nicC [Symbiodinium sp. CCMP2456]